MNANAYDRITERITALLEQGTVPWRKPWTAKTAWPRNFTTRRPYRGINVFLLTAMSYESPFWLTFHQASELGGKVRQGEKACPIVFWKPLKIADEASGQEKHIPLLRLYHVFNVAQCEGLGEAPAVDVALTPLKPAEIVAAMPDPPVIKHGMTAAFYAPREDVVGLPHRERFESTNSYFATCFHELVHSTGHEKRLHRSTLSEHAGFGSDPYCKEELIAEMGAAFLCGYAEILDHTIASSAAYIQNWLARIQHDKTLIVQAAAQAQKAADLILGRGIAEPAEAPP